MKNVLMSLVILTASFLVACGNQFSADVDQSVSDNQNSRSLLEWEQSKKNPEKLFVKWQHDFMTDSAKREDIKAKICETLLSLDGQSLSIFEQEINKVQNRNLVSSCKESLLAKLNAYYDQQRPGMAVQLNALAPNASQNNFQFALNVQKRDLSNGYFAATGDVAKKEVIITFDDGPSDVYTESILRTLKEVNAKAIFFHLGKQVDAHPEVVKKVAAEGHAVGTHSISHACLNSTPACAKTNGGKIFTFDEAVAEVRGGHQAVQRVLGWVDPFFRFPYGESSVELKAFLKRNQVGEFNWNIDSEDWKAQSNESMIATTLKQLDAKGRGIILFHDIQRKTAESLPTLLREIYQRGFSVVLLQSADADARMNSKLAKPPLP